MWKAALRVSRSSLPSSAGAAGLARSPSLCSSTAAACRSASSTAGLQRRDAGGAAAAPANRAATNRTSAAPLLSPRLSTAAASSAAAAARQRDPGIASSSQEPLAAAAATTTSLPAVDQASIKDLLVKLQDRSGAAAPAGDSRLTMTIQTLSALVKSPDAATVDGAAIALSSTLLLLAAGRSSSSSVTDLVADAAAAAIDRQPLPVLLATAKELEADDVGSAAEKSCARKQLVAVLKVKLADTADPSHILAALHTCNAVGAAASSAGGRPPAVYAELRDVAELGVLRLAARMDGPSLCRVLHLLAAVAGGGGGGSSSGGGAARAHSVQLMRTVAYQAANRRFVLTGQQLANTLYACAALGLHDRRLLARLDEVATFAARRDRLAADSLSSVILSLGKLRWHSPELLEALCDRCAAVGVASLKPAAAAALLRTCAQLSYAPSGLALIADQALGRVASNADLLLDATWSLLAVGAQSSAHLAAVLDAGFLKSLGDLNLAGHKKVYNDLKLLNIAFAAACGDKRELESLHQKLIGHMVDVHSIKTVPKEKSAAVLVDDISTVLSYIAPKSTHQNHRVMTMAGHDIDIELLVDSDGQPKPLNDYARPYYSSPTSAATAGGSGGNAGSAQVPAGWHWVALKVLGYYDVLLSAEPMEHSSRSLPTEHGGRRGRCKPIGRHQLAERQLTSMGYTVVMVDYKEYLPGAETPDKLDLLRKKIAASLQ